MWFPFQTKVACILNLGVLPFMDFEEPCYCFQVMTVSLAALVTLFFAIRSNDETSVARKRRRSIVETLDSPIKEYEGLTTPGVMTRSKHMELLRDNSIAQTPPSSYTTD